MPKSKRIAIIGAGISGLTAAIKLAGAGHRVEVFETSDHIGGKLGTYSFEGFRWDTGPSLFTLPEEVLAVINQSKATISFEYLKLTTITKYFFHEHRPFAAVSDRNEYCRTLANEFGVNIDEITKHFDWCKNTYEGLGDFFLNTDLQQASSYFTAKSLRAFSHLISSPVLTTMHNFHKRKLKHPHLIQYFDRFATYNGSNPYKAPAILGMIPHLEHTLGAYFPVGGMRRIPEALYETAASLGVTFNLNTQVSRIITQNGKLKGLRANGFDDLYDRIVSAIDVHKLYSDLLPHKYHAKRYKSLQPSTSALVFLWAVKGEFQELDLHNIFFSKDYKKEFDALENNTIATSDFTIYLNISSKMDPADAPSGCENWFILVNAPANEDQDWEKLVSEVRNQIYARINAELNTSIEKLIVHEKVYAPPMHEELTGSYKGALYGSASNSRFAAFFRHGNRAPKLKNLYVCGGSVHPGGGIPLCIKSGNLAAQALIDDLGKESKPSKKR